MTATAQKLPENENHLRIITGFIHPKQIILNLIENTPLIIYSFYESDNFYNVEILLAAQATLTELINRMPSGVMYHINAHSRHFEFFIDKDFKPLKKD